MSKRGNGEGGIYQRKSDGKWCGSVVLDGSKRKVLYGKTRREVANKLVALQRDQQRGVPVLSDRLTVGGFLPTWLVSVKLTVKPRTWTRYEGLTRLHLVPTLGKLPLAKLDRHHLSTLYAEKVEGGAVAAQGEPHAPRPAHGA